MLHPLKLVLQLKDPFLEDVIVLLEVVTFCFPLVDGDLFLGMNEAALAVRLSLHLRNGVGEGRAQVTASFLAVILVPVVIESIY